MHDNHKVNDCLVYEKYNTAVDQNISMISCCFGKIQLETRNSLLMVKTIKQLIYAHSETQRRK